MLAFRSLAVVALLTISGFAQAADAPNVVYPAPAEMYSACGDWGVLGSIKGRFAGAERRLWHRGYVMKTLENPRPSGHPYAEPGLIKRDYCMADAIMTNGAFRTVYYVIEHGVGFAGIGRSVDFCVLGLDPWHIYDGACRTVR